MVTVEKSDNSKYLFRIDNMKKWAYNNLVETDKVVLSVGAIAFQPNNKGEQDAYSTSQRLRSVSTTNLNRVGVLVFLTGQVVKHLTGNSSHSNPCKGAYTMTTIEHYNHTRPAAQKPIDVIQPNTGIVGVMPGMYHAYYGGAYLETLYSADYPSALEEFHKLLDELRDYPPLDTGGDWYVCECGACVDEGEDCWACEEVGG